MRRRTITRQKAEDSIQTYLEFAAGGLTADTLLYELDFLLNPDERTDGFSLSRLGRGEAAVLFASKNNSTDINDYMARIWTSDLIKMANAGPVMIAVNTGYYPQIDRLYELVETVSQKIGVHLFYSAYDLFSNANEERARAFAKMFRYILT